jgi:hypothetical protein
MSPATRAGVSLALALALCISLAFVAASPAQAVDCPGPDAFGYTCTANPGRAPIGAANDLMCADCGTVTVALPFAFRFYDLTLAAGTPINISQHGNVQFLSNSGSACAGSIPDATYDYVIYALCGDFTTDVPGGGIFTNTTGVAPK